MQIIKNAANNIYAPLKKILELYYRPRQYTKKWGRTVGSKLYSEFYNHDDKTLIEFKLPEYPFPLKLRKHTSDEPTFRQIFLNTRYNISIEFEPLKIIDGGANIGYSSVFFAHKYPKAEIIAIEPDKSNFELLQYNTANYAQVKNVNSALWHKSAFLKIANPNTEKWAFQVIETNKGDVNSFDSCSIQDLMNLNSWDHIDILKLDIEGAEKFIFSENYELWLPRTKILIIELHERMQPGCTEIFYQAIKKYDFKESISGENLVFQNRNIAL